MAVEPILRLTGLVKYYGGLLATDHVSLTVEAGECHALIGPNGAGKTTLIGQISGERRQDQGSIHFAGADMSDWPMARRVRHGLARSFQITSILPNFTAEDNVAIAVQGHQGHSFHFFRDAFRDPTLRQPARAVLERVGLADRATIRAADLAYGEQRQLELAMALATGPKLLLLDEPMAGLGHDESRRMVALLTELKRDIAILLVEHDMDAVFALADRITVLVYGKAIRTGPPADIRADAEVRAAYLGTEEA